MPLDIMLRVRFIIRAAILNNEPLNVLRELYYLYINAYYIVWEKYNSVLLVVEYHRITVEGFRWCIFNPINRS